MGWFDADSKHWARTGVIIASVLSVVGLVFAAPAFWGAVTASSGQRASTGASSTASSAETVIPEEPTPSDSEFDEPSSEAPSSDESSTEPRDQGNASTTVASIHVSFDDVVSFKVGKKVGPSTWQLSDWGGKPTADISVAWEARSDDNVKIDSDSCEVIISITGPTDASSIRSSACSQGHVSGFRDESVVFRLHVQGNYTVTVTDKVSGVEGSDSFVVVA